MKFVSEELLKLQDTEYRTFMSKLLPTVGLESILGIRTPELKKLSEELTKQKKDVAFIRTLPHEYFEENQVHAFIISGYKDFNTCIKEICRFLPFVDNWATCDQLSPKILRKHHQELLPYIHQWLSSDRTYTVRFAIKILMDHFLEEDFDAQYPELVASVRSEEYYINMMRAWYFATGLAKQSDSFLPYIEQTRLDSWTHNKTIQKSVESYRIPVEMKETLKKYRIRK